MQESKAVRSIDGVNLQKLLKARERFVYVHTLGLANTIKKEQLVEQIKILLIAFHTYSYDTALSRHISASTINQVRTAL